MKMCTTNPRLGQERQKNNHVSSNDQSRCWRKAWALPSRRRFRLKDQLRRRASVAVFQHPLSIDVKDRLAGEVTAGSVALLSENRQAYPSLENLKLAQRIPSG